MRILLLAALFLLPVAAEKRGAVPTGDIDSRKGELELIKRNIEDGRREIGKLSDKETDLSQKLQKIDDNITLVGNYLRKLGDQEGAMKDDIDSIQVDLTRTTGNLAWRKELLKERARKIYMRGRYDAVDMIFSANSFSDFFRRNTFYKVLADNDHRLITGIFNQQKMIKLSKARLENRLADIQEVKSEKAKEQSFLSAQRKNREKILKQIKGKKETYLKLVADLEKRKAEINRIIESLEEARRRSLETRKGDRFADFGDFGKLKGRLPWPVEGKIIKRFGTNVHPVYKTKTINNGVDIEVGSGTEIAAVASGEVVYTGTLSSFGNFVIIGHSSGFYTLYANLSFISVHKGESVPGGRTVGLSGDTGSLDGSKLHFELRRERQILDPSDWLSKR